VDGRSPSSAVDTSDKRNLYAKLGTTFRSQLGTEVWGLCVLLNHGTLVRALQTAIGTQVHRTLNVSIGGERTWTVANAHAGGCADAAAVLSAALRKGSAVERAAAGTGGGRRDARDARRTKPRGHTHAAKAEQAARGRQRPPQPTASSIGCGS
jgi:hypothetical protein